MSLDAVVGQLSRPVDRESVALLAGLGLGALQEPSKSLPVGERHPVGRAPADDAVDGARRRASLKRDWLWRNQSHSFLDEVPRVGAGAQPGAFFPPFCSLRPLPTSALFPFCLSESVCSRFYGSQPRLLSLVSGRGSGPEISGHLLPLGVFYNTGHGRLGWSAARVPPPLRFSPPVAITVSGHLGWTGAARLQTPSPFVDS